MIWDVLFNVSYWIIKGYLSTSSSKKDEMLLDMLKMGVGYMAQKDNNNVTFIDYQNLEKTKVKGDKK